MEAVAGYVDEEWSAYVAARRDAELAQTIRDESLRLEAARESIDRGFRDCAVQSTGVAITKVLPPVSRFAADSAHGEKKQRVLDRLGECFGLG